MPRFIEVNNIFNGFCKAKDYGDEAFDSYNAGVSEAMHYLRENNINQDSIDTKAFIEANIKRRIAEDLEDHQLYELAVEEMNDALKPAMMRMFNGKLSAREILCFCTGCKIPRFIEVNNISNGFHRVFCHAKDAMKDYIIITLTETIQQTNTMTVAIVKKYMSYSVC